MPPPTPTARTPRSLAARVALAAIRGYQRFLSPHKGFCCALHVATGGASCSAHGHAMIARFGLRRGLALLERRFALCAHAHRRLREAAPTPAPRPPLLARLHRQRGVCDLPCDCDGVDRMTDLCDLADCCDWESKRGKRRRQERAERERRALDAALERIRRKRHGRQ